VPTSWTLCRFKHNQVVGRYDGVQRFRPDPDLIAETHAIALVVYEGEVEPWLLRDDAALNELRDYYRDQWDTKVNITTFTVKERFASCAF
jgi:asparagine synthetase A